MRAATSLAGRAPAARVAPGFAGPDRLLSWAVPGPDGRSRTAWLFVPDAGARRIPLVLSPHPFGFTAIVNLFGEPAGGPRTLAGIPGIMPAAAGVGAAVLCIDAEGARYSGMSVGWPAQLAAYRDAAHTALAADLGLDPARVAACGLSMGGQESLLLATAFPELVRAAAVQNAVTDLAGWHGHLASRPALAAHARALADEMGGDPGATPERWRAQSPIARLHALPAATPVQLRVTADDGIVPAASQGVPYHAAARARGCAVELVEGRPADLDPRDRGRAAHERVDWTAMLQWLLARV